MALTIALLLAVEAISQPPSKPDERVDRASKLEKLSKQQFEAGRLPDAEKTLSELLKLRRAMFGPKEFPNGHADIVWTLNALGTVLRDRGEFTRSLEHHKEALSMSQKLFPAREHPAGHARIAESLNLVGLCLKQAGKEDEAIPYYEQSLAMRRRLYPGKEHPDGHSEIAQSLSNLGVLYRDIGEYAKAKVLLEEALSMRKRLIAKDHSPELQSDYLKTVSGLAMLLSEMGDDAAAAERLDEVLTVRRRLFPAEKFPSGHIDLARAMFNLACCRVELGELRAAEQHFTEGLAMCRRLFVPTEHPNGHDFTASFLHGLGTVYHARGAHSQALTHYEQALAMRRQLYPREKNPEGHFDLVQSFNDLAILLTENGEYERAMPYQEEALSMLRRLFPEKRFPHGHVFLVDAMANLAGTLDGLQRPDKALPIYEQALAMARKIFPPQDAPAGHPAVVGLLTNLANCHLRLKQNELALVRTKDALQMAEALYPAATFPNGHELLVSNLGHWAVVHSKLGKFDEARAAYNRATAMARRLFPADKYPLGHSSLTAQLVNQTDLAQQLGDYSFALKTAIEALQIAEKRSIAIAESAPEAEALFAVENSRRSRDAYLTASSQFLDRAPESYARVWRFRSLSMRVLQRRQSAMRAALSADPEIRRAWQDLQDTRQRLVHLLLQPGRDPGQRDRNIRQATEQKEKLERSLAQRIPGVTPTASTIGPDQLAKALRPGSVFIDILQYERRGQQPTPAPEHYVAFVIAAGKAVKRVELGSAVDIDRSVANWRRAIEQRRDDAAAETLLRSVWKPLAREIPDDTRTIYVAPDGDLSRLPWPALPDSDRQSVLLERYAFAIVPHGPFLFEQLAAKEAQLTDTDTALIVGDVDYGAKRPNQSAPDFDILPGAANEIDQICQSSGSRPMHVLRRTDASADRVMEKLPDFRVAHFATHGFFAAEMLAKEHQTLSARLDHWQFRDGITSEGLRAGARSPLAYSGIVLSGANEHRAHGLITGEAIVDRPLDRLYLTVLSACETGLGELTGGEGVFGLTRAFHLAGCPNVIASLWKVNDAATAALMAKFYHELWVNKKPPIEALREAQLTIYRHPERITALAGERGKPDFTKTVELKIEPRASASADKRTPTKMWAAFVLSGVGK